MSILNKKVNKSKQVEPEIEWFVAKGVSEEESQRRLDKAFDILFDLVLKDHPDILKPTVLK